MKRNIKFIKRIQNKMMAGILILMVITGSLSELRAHSEYGFNVEVKGKGDPILLIPGLISSGEVWDDTVDHFSEWYELHVITFQGYAGISPQEDGPYLDNWKNQVITYIKEQNLQNVTIAGHSLGGFMGLWIASEDLPELKQLIVIDALPFLPAASNPAAEPGFNKETAEKYIESFSGFDQEQLYNMRMMMARSMTSDSTRWEQLTEWAMASDLKTEAYSAAEMMGMDLREAIADITVPVLAIGAYEKNSQFPGYTMDMMRQTYASQYEKIPDLQFEVAEDSKHFIMYDKPAWMHRMMYEFMTEKDDIER